ncbi:hypothetical protein AB8U03_17410 [Clostridium sp. Mt-5]|uniref:RES domain-containing protein n=1 Tax=Clostridium moutaii TaxID=3240932 RepID=A0ABV4BV66_9CLOT
MRYNWYEEDFTSFLLKYNLPAYNKNFEIKRYYKKMMDNFLSDFDNMINRKENRFHSQEFYKKLSETKKDIRINFKKILKVFSLYDNLNFKEAQIVFDDLLENMKDDLLITGINGIQHCNTGLFRIRKVKTGKNLKRPSELFHIPYMKRNLVTNERYSLAGHPCLYLATYLGIAWQECGLPKKFYYSEFQYVSDPNPNNDWKFITFISPRKFANDALVAMSKDNEDSLLKSVCKYIKTYSLILACSIVNLSGKSVFKPEYIISQMLLQWVCRNSNIIRGITYFSCIDNDDLRRIDGYNIVIPAIKFNRRGFCKDLINKFKVSKPVYCDNLLLKDKHISISNFKNDLKLNLNNFPYEAMDCIIAMYDVCNCFDNLVTYTESSDMKLIVELIKSIRMNCSYIRLKYQKDVIIQKTKMENPCDNKIKKFIEFYDRFWHDVEAIIFDYASWLDKIYPPGITNFYTI